jgi:hypothetical protein
VGDDGVLLGAGARGGAGGEHQQSRPAAGAFAVDDLHALAQAALGQQPVGLASGLEGTRDAAGQVDRDDVPAGLDQRLPDREEVADRGLGGRRQFGVGAQALVESVEAAHLELSLSADLRSVALPAHIQADLVNAFAVR